MDKATEKENRDVLFIEDNDFFFFKAGDSDIEICKLLLICRQCCVNSFLPERVGA